MVRSPANSSAKLLAALQPLIDMGLPREEVYRIGMGRFPIAGLANFTHDWLFPRFAGSFHLHKGTDVFAAMDVPVRSPADGILRQSTDNLGGISAYVTEPDGTYYYLAHLSGYVEGQASGQKVKVGDIIGYNGNSGDARGGAPHVHFQVHPLGGAPVDPKAHLDAWLDEALADAPGLVARLRPSATSAAPRPSLRFLPTTAAAFEAPATPAPSQLLWASAASPQGGALQLAESAARAAARSVSWAAEARRSQEQQVEWSIAFTAAVAAARPLVPTPLWPMLGLRRS